MKRMTQTLFFAATVVSLACTGRGLDDDLDEPVGVSQVQEGITLPGTQFGTYCSTTFSNGTWGLNALPHQNSNPCSIGGTVRRVGYWSLSGWNTVIARCNGGAFTLRHGAGGAPITAASAWAQPLNNCIFTISARDMPIFQTPFDSNPVNLGHSSGFDHARGLDSTTGQPVFIDTQAIGTGGLFGVADIVDHQGKPHRPIYPQNSNFTINDKRPCSRRIANVIRCRETEASRIGMADPTR
jgi:hypothetical protein